MEQQRLLHGTNESQLGTTSVTLLQSSDSSLGLWLQGQGQGIPELHLQAGSALNFEDTA